MQIVDSNVMYEEVQRYVSWRCMSKVGSGSNGTLVIDLYILFTIIESAYTVMGEPVHGIIDWTILNFFYMVYRILHWVVKNIFNEI